MKFLGTFFASFLLLLPSVANAHKLIDANESVKVARSDMAVTPATDWNRISQRPGSNAERWTIDGELLNDVLFFGEVQGGDTLFREVDRRNSPLPEFSETMLLIDLPSFYGSSLRITKGVSVFEVDVAEPVEFLSQPGIRFEYRALGADDIWRRGHAVATILDEELFMISYEAPTIYFFEKNITDFEQLVSSSHLD